jgi:HAD superfamily hydrolase (TIGR01509 family)
LDGLCIIFDLDGTLVDSETLCNQAFVDLLPKLDEPASVLTQRYRGQKLSGILRDLAMRLQTELPADFERRYRARVAELFAAELRPTPGTMDMLSQLDGPMCIASSGPMPKITQALAVTGLLPYFDGRVFSAYEVGAWKPDPGLFLHAAKAMSHTPDQCIVVEDSEPGLLAAKAAGMRAIHYRPDASVPAVAGTLALNDMAGLHDLLCELA